MRERKRARVSGWVGWYQGKEEEEGGDGQKITH